MFNKRKYLLVLTLLVIFMSVEQNSKCLPVVSIKKDDSKGGI